MKNFTSVMPTLSNAITEIGRGVLGSITAFAAGEVMVTEGGVASVMVLLKVVGL